MFNSIKLTTRIAAPLERVFDLSLSIDLHLKSAQNTREKVVSGKSSGIMELGDEVTWEAYHFCMKQRLSVKISKYNRPFFFRDQQVKGPFKTFYHDHYFEKVKGICHVKDVLYFQCPLGALGAIANPMIYIHLKRFLQRRNSIIKSVAESDQWENYC